MTARWTIGWRSHPSGESQQLSSSDAAPIPIAILHKDFAEFLRLLNAHEVRYLVVGGYAVVIHGYPRYTGDLDIFVEASTQNAKLLVDVYGEYGIDQPGLDPSLFTTPGNVVRVGSEPVRLEVLTRISGVSSGEAYARRYEVTLGDLKLPFISYEDLIKNKESTGRGKDRADVEALKRRSRD